MTVTNEDPGHSCHGLSVVLFLVRKVCPGQKHVPTITKCLQMLQYYADGCFPA